MKNTYYVASWLQGEEEGLIRIVYDPSSNTLYSKERINNNRRSSYFVKNDELLYVLTEAPASTPNMGLITMYKMDDGGLKELSKSHGLESGLTHLSLSFDKKHLYASGYVTGSITIVDTTGKTLSNERAAYHHEGSSINQKRQQSSHMHFSIQSPDHDYLLACDLGSDEIHIFEIDQARGDLRICQSIKTPLGYGPRHMIFSNDGKHAYVLCELSYHLLVYSYEKGSLVLVNNIDLIPDCPAEARAGSAIKLSHDGKTLFTANRGNGYACIDAWDLANPYSPQRSDSYDKVTSPRDFTVFEDGYIAICNQNEDNIQFIRFIDNRFESVGTINDVKMPVSIIGC